MIARVLSGSRTILSDIKVARSFPMLNIMTVYDTENNRYIFKIAIVIDRIRATFIKNTTNKRENLSIEKEIDSEGKAK
jgi:uncharacterized protein YqfB (UPF0267 family)